MDFGNACLFSKKPEDMRRIGALGGRARARNLRFRKASQVSITREYSRPHEETVATAGPAGSEREIARRSRRSARRSASWLRTTGLRE